MASSTAQPLARYGDDKPEAINEALARGVKTQPIHPFLPVPSAAPPFITADGNGPYCLKNPIVLLSSEPLEECKVRAALKNGEEMFQ